MVTPDTSHWKQTKELVLDDFKYTHPEYTESEMQDGWYRFHHEPELKDADRTDSTIVIYLVGNIAGGQPLYGTIEVKSDTLFLKYGIDKSKPGYTAYRKVGLFYTIGPIENFDNPVIVPKYVW